MIQLKDIPILTQVIDNLISESEMQELQEQFYQWHQSSCDDALLTADLKDIRDSLEQE